MKIITFVNENMALEHFTKEIELKIAPKLYELVDLILLIQMSYTNAGNNPQLAQKIQSLPPEEEAKLDKIMQTAMSYKDHAETISRDMQGVLKTTMTASYSQRYIYDSINKCEAILNKALQHLRAFVRYFISKGYVNPYDDTALEVIRKYIDKSYNPLPTHNEALKLVAALIREAKKKVLSESNALRNHLIQKLNQLLALHQNKGQLYMRFSDNENSEEINPNYQWTETPKGLYTFTVDPNYLKRIINDMRRKYASDVYNEWAYERDFLTIFTCVDPSNLLKFDSQNRAFDPNPRFVEDFLKLKTLLTQEGYPGYPIAEISRILYPQNFDKRNVEPKISFKTLMDYLDSLSKFSSEGKMMWLQKLGYSGIETKGSSGNAHGGFGNETVFFDPSILKVEYKGPNIFKEFRALLNSTRPSPDKPNPWQYAREYIKGVKQQDKLTKG